jgi:predicted O-methyltransferase YrrM
MTPAEIIAVVGDTPHTSHARGEELYGFARKHGLSRCLELGFAHGVGTVWLAGAMQSLGGGKVIAVDNDSARARVPGAQEMVDRAGLGSLVELHFDPISYTWHLQRNLAAYANAPFDFVFIDGAHTWDTDGFAFFLVERILRPGGWVLFDDLDWSFSKSPALRAADSVRAMPEELRSTPQVRQVWEKLVMTHSAFGNFVEEDNWGWAQKVADHAAPRRLEIRKSSVSLPERIVRRVRRKWGARR